MTRPGRYSAVLLVGLLLSSIALLPITAEAVVTVESQLFLHNKTKSFLGRVDQRTMDAFRPTSPADSIIDIGYDPNAWVLDLELGAAESFKISNDVQGVIWYDTNATVAAVKLVNMTLYDLPPNGTLIKIGEESQEIELEARSSLHPLAPKPSKVFVIPTRNLTNPVIERGHSIAVGFTAIAANELVPPTPPEVPPEATANEFRLIYDSEQHPSYINFTYETATVAKVKLIAAERDLVVEPGHSVNFSMTLQNLGDLQDTINITNSTLLPGWDVIITPFRFRMEGNASANFTVEVVAPPNPPAGQTQAVAIYAVSARGATDVADLLARVSTGQGPPVGETCPDGSLRPSVGDCPAGNNETGNNTGGNDGPDGQFAQPFNPLRPVADSFRSMFASVPTLRDNADALSMVFLLLLLLIILVIVLGSLSTRPKILLKLKAARLMVEPGKARLLDIVVTNKGRLPEYVQLGLEPLPSAWAASLARTEFTLDPRETVTLGLLLKPPQDWPAPSRKTVEVVLRSKRRPKYERSVTAKVIVVRKGKAARPAKEKRVRPVREKGRQGPKEPIARPGPKEDVFSLSAEMGEDESLPEGELPDLPTPAERPLIEKELESGLPSGAIPGAPSGFEDVHILEVKNEPEEVVRGEIVTTTITLENTSKKDAGGIAVRLIVNEKLRDQKVLAIRGERRMTVTFKWEAYLANNSVRVQVA